MATPGKIKSLFDESFGDAYSRSHSESSVFQFSDVSTGSGQGFTKFQFDSRDLFPDLCNRTLATVDGNKNYENR